MMRGLMINRNVVSGGDRQRRGQLSGPGRSRTGSLEREGAAASPLHSFQRAVLTWGFLGEGRRGKHREVPSNSQNFLQGDRLPLVEHISCHGKQAGKA